MVNILYFLIQEIAVLSDNLELCQKELIDKYGAMKEIHMQSRLEQAQNRKMTKKALEASKQLEQVSVIPF